MTMNSFPFITTSEQRVRVYDIAARMKAHGLPTSFIADAVRMAEEYEGLYDLMALWDEEEDEVSRCDIVADIQEELVGPGWKVERSELERYVEREF